MAICSEHCVSNCSLCAGEKPPETVGEVRPLNEQPKQVLTDPTAQGIMSAADKYAKACEELKHLELDLGRIKGELSVATVKYTQALEDKKAAKMELAKSLKEEE